MGTQPKTEPNVQQAVPFFRVSSTETSLRFYVDGLGFEMTKKWTPDGDGKVRWCWLQHGNAAIMLQEYRKEAPTPGFRKASGRRFHLLPVQGRSGSLQTFEARKIEAQRPFVGNAMWITSVQDPDYKLEFESYTDVPEETVFSEPE